MSGAKPSHYPTVEELRRQMTQWLRIRNAGDALRKHGFKHAACETVLLDDGRIDYEVWLCRPDAPNILVGAIEEIPEDKIDPMGLSMAIVEVLNSVLDAD